MDKQYQKLIKNASKQLSKYINTDFTIVDEDTNIRQHLDIICEKITSLTSLVDSYSSYLNTKK